MNTLILHVDGRSKWVPEAAFKFLGGQEVEVGHFVLELGGEYLSLTRHPDAQLEYDDPERRALLAIVQSPRSYVIGWSGLSLLRRFIANIPVNCMAAVDNDHGLICRIADVRTRNVESWIKASRFK